MNFYKKIFFIYVFLIFITLPFAGPFARYLRSKVLDLNTSVFLSTIFIFFVCVFSILYIFKYSKTGFIYIFLNSFIVLFLFFLSLTIKTPEEKLHLVLYFGMGVLGFIAFEKKFFKVFLIIVFISFLDEFFQYLIPTRVGDLKDVIHNTVGGISGLVFVKLLQR